GLMGTFVDDNPNATTSEYIVGLYWGDGTFNLGSVVSLGKDAAGKALFAIYGYHAYSTPGTTSFTLAVYDVHGSSCIVYSPTVVVFAPTQFLDLWAINADVVRAAILYQTYSGAFSHDGLAYQQSLAAYWLAVSQAD